MSFTQTGVEITTCATCSKDHPESRQHCTACGNASAFINLQGFCLNHKAEIAGTDGTLFNMEPTC